MTQIFPSSLQWNHIRFRIQLILADPSIQIVKIIKYSYQFEQKLRNHMKIDCAINTNGLKESQIQSLRYGNPSKFIFQAGHVKSPSIEQGSMYSGQTSQRNKILLFKIAVNQIMPIHRSGLEQLQNIIQFPDQIDTIYVSENKQQLNIYPHQYKVREKSQCCLQYEVDFIRPGLNSMAKWNPNQLTCQYCQIAKALYYCPQDKELYCGKCYEDLHRSSKKKAHEQLKLTPFNSPPFCSFHTKQRQQFYCLNCMDLKCQVCVKNQTSRSDKKHSQIMPLTQLQQTLRSKQQSFLKQAKQRTKSLLTKAESVMARLTKNYQNQKTILQQSFVSKLTKIREESNKKIMKIVGLHSQLKRKYDQFLWAENFLHYCEDFLVVQDNIQMKDSFFVYLENITAKEFYQAIQRNIEEIK